MFKMFMREVAAPGGKVRSVLGNTRKTTPFHRTLAVLVAGTVFAGHASAVCSGGSCTNEKVAYLIVYVDGTIQVRTETTHADPVGANAALTCSLPGNGNILVPSGSGTDSVLSTLLTANAQDVDIAVFRLNENSSACELQYVSIY